MPKKRVMPDQKAYLVISRGRATVTKDLVYITPHNIKRGKGQFHIFSDCNMIFLGEEELRLEPSEILRSYGFTLCKKCADREQERATDILPTESGGE